MQRNQRFAVLCAVILTVPFARGQSTVLWRTNYYTVTGATLREINQSFSQSRPWKNKSSLDGLTDWRVDWKFNVTQSDSGCRLSYFTTTTTINITLPKWVAPTNTSPSVKEIWGRYITALGQHENGHGQFAAAAASEIHKRIKEVSEGSDCGSLRNNVTSLCSGVVETYKQRDKEYDVRTEHGAQQGARLPARDPAMGRPQ